MQRMSSSKHLLARKKRNSMRKDAYRSLQIFCWSIKNEVGLQRCSATREKKLAGRRGLHMRDRAEGEEEEGHLMLFEIQMTSCLFMFSSSRMFFTTSRTNLMFLVSVAQVTCR
jgi:hypothetical protein